MNSRNWAGTGERGNDFTFESAKIIWIRPRGNFSRWARDKATVDIALKHH